MHILIGVEILLKLNYNTSLSGFSYLRGSVPSLAHSARGSLRTRGWMAASYRDRAGQLLQDSQMILRAAVRGRGAYPSWLQTLTLWPNSWLTKKATLPHCASVSAFVKIMSSDLAGCCGHYLNEEVYYTVNLYCSYYTIF